MAALPPKAAAAIARRRGSYAISGTLDGLANKLAAAAAEAVNSPPDELPDNLEDYDELADEWEEDGDAPPIQPGLPPEQLAQLRVLASTKTKQFGPALICGLICATSNFTF